jgi:hypothetical protein
MAAAARMVPMAMLEGKTWVEILRDSARPVKGKDKAGNVVDSGIVVSSPTVYLSKGKGEEVEWFSREEAFTVRFDKNGTPFHDSEFFVPKNGSVGSGPIAVKVNNKTGDRYSYSIIDANGVTLDPDVIIKE